MKNFICFLVRNEKFLFKSFMALIMLRKPQMRHSCCARKLCSQLSFSLLALLIALITDQDANTAVLL